MRLAKLVPLAAALLQETEYRAGDCRQPKKNSPRRAARHLPRARDRYTYARRTNRAIKLSRRSRMTALPMMS